MSRFREKDDLIVSIPVPPSIIGDASRTVISSSPSPEFIYNFPPPPPAVITSFPNPELITTSE